MSDRDRESQLDRDGDRCPASEVFPVLAVGYIQTLHLSGKSLVLLATGIGDPLENWLRARNVQIQDRCPDLK